VKNLKFLFLAIAIGIAPALTAKGSDAAAEAILGPLAVMDDIKTSQETLKNLDQLLKLSAQLMVITQGKFDQIDDDSHATAAAKADARADYQAATNDYTKLLAWREHVEDRIRYDKMILAGAGISDRGRDSAKDAAQTAREASTDAARRSASEAGRGGVDNCPQPMHP
jgi:hypothetical protein